MATHPDTFTVAMYNGPRGKTLLDRYSVKNAKYYNSVRAPLGALAFSEEDGVHIFLTKLSGRFVISAYQMRREH